MVTRTALLAAIGAALASSSLAGIPPLNPTPSPGPNQAQQPRPKTLNFGQKFLDESFAAFMATDPPPAPLNQTIPFIDVDIGCNYNVAPAPLNWKMWCAGAAPGWPAVNKATVTQGQAYDGTYRRIITLDPQPGLTAAALQWYTSGLSTPVVTWEGRKWYWYELWHPIDHIESKNRIANPEKSDALRLRAQTLIHERYMNAPASYTGDYTYGTDAWFTVVGPDVNWAARRQEIALFTQGYQAWTLILSLQETAGGGVITAELILGVPAQGSDPVNPMMGLPLAEAQAINQAAFIPYVENLRTNPTFEAGFDSMSRHIVEEFSNIGRFVPELYKTFKANPTGAIPTGGLDPLGAVFNLTNSVPEVFLKNDTLLTVGLPLSVPGPKRSPIQLPYLKNETDELTAKVEDIKAAINEKVMALGVGKAGHNHTH